VYYVGDLVVPIQNQNIDLGMLSGMGGGMMGGGMMGGGMMRGGMFGGGGF